jgi:hypothetical protein
MTRTTDSLRTRMDAAAERAEAEKAKLYRPDGSTVYAQEEHAERVAEIAEGVARVTEEVRADADRIVEEKRADLDAIVYADPTEALTPEELEEANARARFVREDCEAMAPGELARRIRGVSAGGDKATAWLYARYAGARHERELAADRHRAAEDLAALGELRDAVPALEERLRDPAKERRRQSAEKELAAAERLKFHALRRRSEADGTDELAREAQRASGFSRI